jgi:hypothetical protein
VRAWFECCDAPKRVEYVLSIDAGRQNDFLRASHAELMKTKGTFGRVVRVENFGRPCAVDGWNAAAATSTGRFLITVSDDYRPCEHWDTELLKAIPDINGEYVMDVDNQDNSYPLLPFSFLTRAYYKRLGYLFYPEFFGMMADNDFTDVARRDRVVVDARHLKFTHLHPHRGTAPDDEVYRWQQRPEAWEAGNRVYHRRKAEREGKLC